MKVIFLDVDGVLNRWPPKEGDPRSWPFEDETISYGFLPEPVSVISELVNNHDVKIVVSSSWRDAIHPKKFADELNVPVESVIAKTGRAHRRGIEILQWLQDDVENKNVEEFAIIDDSIFDIVCDPELKGHIVMTLTDVGLEKTHLSQLKKILKID